MDSDVPFSVLVRCADHLGKINNDRFASFSMYKDIEFVTVSVY